MVNDFFGDERGATALEYGLIAAVMVLVMLVGLIVLTDEMNNMYSGSGGSLASTIGNAGS